MDGLKSGLVQSFKVGILSKSESQPGKQSLSPLQVSTKKHPGLDAGVFYKTNVSKTLKDNEEISLSSEPVEIQQTLSNETKPV